MSDLHLNLKGIYFDQIKQGFKKVEWRLYNDYWIKRLIDRSYNNIYIKRGYPKKDDKEKIIKLPYRGYFITNIIHSEFNGNAKVFGIPLTDD